MSDLQFEQAQGVATAAPACQLCQTPIATTYYETGGEVICPTCREKLLAPPSLNAFAGFAKAAVFGIGAGILSALADGLITAVTGISFGIVWLFLGGFIGRTVIQNSGGRGGILFKLLALAITYFSIGLSMGVFMVTKLPDMDALKAVIILFLCFFAWPWGVFMEGGVSMVLGFVIYGFGLVSAWGAATRPPLVINGPFQVKPPEPEPEPVPTDAGNDLEQPPA